MSRAERECLAAYARGCKNALEIGTFMGVSACDIAQAIEGRLTCVDPWPTAHDPNLAITQREFARHGVAQRIDLVRAFSHDVEPMLDQYDFIFVDGDHSEAGITGDWALVRRHLQVDGIVCLHDTTAWDGTQPQDSVCYYERVIRHDPDFASVARVHSLNVLHRLTPNRDDGVGA